MLIIIGLYEVQDFHMKDNWRKHYTSQPNLFANVRRNWYLRQDIESVVVTELNKLNQPHYLRRLEVISVQTLEVKEVMTLLCSIQQITLSTISFSQPKKRIRNNFIVSPARDHGGGPADCISALRFDFRCFSR